MEKFEFIFDGTPHTDGTVTAGIKLLSGKPVDIGLCFGHYASVKLKARESSSAIIVINAYKKFKEMNPDMPLDIERQLQFIDGARIIVKPKHNNDLPKKR